MLSRPSTDQVLLAIADDLRDTVAPVVTDDRATVLLGQVDQLLRRLARRAADEIGWMVEEMAAIEAAVDGDPDDATATALATYRATPTTSMHLADVLERYNLASAALSCAVEAALAGDNADRVAELRALLDARIATEQIILGQLDLVGRG